MKEKPIKCKKIRAGKYKYRGLIISCIGYYEPEKRVVWEAYDPKSGCAEFHGFSKREVKSYIDEDNKNLNMLYVLFCFIYYGQKRIYVSYANMESCGLKEIGNVMKKLNLIQYI